MVDYLVIGLGLAGISLCEELEAGGHSFRVIADTDGSMSSVVAGGLYNPMVLKRITMSWKADEQLAKANARYGGLEAKLGVGLDYQQPIWRRFGTQEEESRWFEALDKPGFSHYLDSEIRREAMPGLHSPFGYGRVNHTGRIDTRTLVAAYRMYLKNKGALREENFAYDGLQILEDGVSYKDEVARRIVFAEGFGLKQNPFFSYLPLQGTKGELLTVYAPDLRLEGIVKGPVFLIPLGEDLYRVGATYAWDDLTDTPTSKAKAELLKKLDTFINCTYEVREHTARIRPTVPDRRPLVGRHPEQDNIFVLNGLGSRGVLVGPYAAAHLYRFMEYGTSLPEEMDVARYTRKYYAT